MIEFLLLLRVKAELFFFKMCDRREPFESELRNNNEEGGVPADGDANANDIRREDGGRTADPDSPSGLQTETAEEDKVTIWGTDSQCDDPELAEFEMLECQELEAYLVEEGEDFVGLADRKDVQVQSSTCSKTRENATFQKSMVGTRSVQHGGREQEPSASLVSECTEISRTEFNSETDVFLSCMSTISTMDNGVETASMTQMTGASERTRVAASQKAEPPPLSSGKSTIHHIDVDMNLNSTVHSEDVVSQVVPCKDVTDECRRNNNQRNKVGNTPSDCNQKRNTEHKGLATEKKSYEESNTKIDKSTQADEASEGNYSPYITNTKETQSSAESKAMKKQGSFDNMLTKQNSFDKSFKKQPSFENTFRKQHSFDNTLKKQRSFETSITTNSSSLERRRPWGSPSRPTTPTSPKTTSSSPKRRPPGSPAKVQGIRALSLERSDSPQRALSQTAKLPARVSLSSGIPKPVVSLLSVVSQQKESEPRKSSPPQKPKNVRPKIITYVRKNPQTTPPVTNVPIEASTLPLRLSSYPSLPTHKEPKVGCQPKSTPVLCSSNLLFDKYRQEMQKAGCHPPGLVVIGTKPPSSTIPQRLGGKSSSFHKDIPEKNLPEVRNQ